MCGSNITEKGICQQVIFLIPTLEGNRGCGLNNRNHVLWWALKIPGTVKQVLHPGLTTQKTSADGASQVWHKSSSAYILELSLVAITSVYGGQVEDSSPIKYNAKYKARLSGSVVVYFSRGSSNYTWKISRTVLMLEVFFFWKKYINSESCLAIWLSWGTGIVESQKVRKIIYYYICHNTFLFLGDEELP